MRKPGFRVIPTHPAATQRDIHAPLQATASPTITRPTTACFCRPVAGEPRMLPRARAERSEPCEPNESTDATEPADPIARSEPAHPIDPIERTDPAEPIERTEPSLAIESTDPVDIHDQREACICPLIIYASKNARLPARNQVRLGRAASGLLSFTPGRPRPFPPERSRGERQQVPPAVGDQGWMISWTGNSFTSGGPCIATPAATTPA